MLIFDHIKIINIWITVTGCRRHSAYLLSWRVPAAPVTGYGVAWAVAWSSVYTMPASLHCQNNRYDRTSACELRALLTVASWPLTVARLTATHAEVSICPSVCLYVCVWQWRNYNFCPPPANIRYGLTVLIHNSSDFGPPLPFWAPGSPALPGLPMASYATGVWSGSRQWRHSSEIVKILGAKTARGSWQSRCHDAIDDLEATHVGAIQAKRQAHKTVDSRHSEHWTVAMWSLRSCLLIENSIDGEIRCLRRLTP